jgi:hypothetical protein
MVGSVGTLLFPARGQPAAGKVHKIGYLQTSTRLQQTHLAEAFENGLRALGYRVGKDLLLNIVSPTRTWSGFQRLLQN